MALVFLIQISAPPPPPLYSEDLKIEYFVYLNGQYELFGCQMVHNSDVIWILNSFVQYSVDLNTGLIWYFNVPIMERSAIWLVIWKVDYFSLLFEWWSE